MDAVEIGRDAQIRKVIIDKYAEVLPGVKIGFDSEKDHKRFKVTERGIVVIPKGAIVGEDEIRQRWKTNVAS
jgi:glucose-1-phosphate adenylyltransferase